MSDSPLLDCLTREHAAIGAFLDVLEQEVQAMNFRDFTNLALLTEHKSQLTDEIAFIGQQRELEQVRLGYGSDRHGADAAAEAGGEVVQKAWRRLLGRAAQARDGNLRNGVMIHTHLDFTRQTISFLQSRGLPLYGPDGTHKTGTSSSHSRAHG